MFATRASRRRGIAYALLVAASLILLALSGTGLMGELRAGVSFALAPIQSALAGMTRSATSIVSTLGEIDRLRGDNRDLQAANLALEAENRRLQGLVTTNQTLTALMQVRSTLDYRTVAAEVIGRQVSQAERVVSLSVGSDRGVSVGDVVLAGGAALVGRVVEVGPNYSRVLLISDTRSTVIGLVEPSRTTGNIQGQLGGSLVMSQIPSTDVVNVGDEVVTAGIDLGNGIRSPFPKGLLVGRVVDVERDATAVVQTAFVEAAAPLEKLEYVLVITDYEGGIPIAPSPSPEASLGAGASPSASPTVSPGGSPIDLPSPSLQPAP
ncbi:MAG: rod shape-determining protein MreC, rod shape-determining protein MreC [Chloroflexi bacterium CSP1-4]|nr:MAG: rod shape-determining protein MreC, rod shape-determining protein MreC [Chloroflexi bacterium CSP1-4]